MFESPVQKNLSSRILATMFFTFVRGRQTTGFAQLKIASFSHTLSFSAFAQGDLFRIYVKALQIVKLEFSRQPSEELVSLACTVID